MGYEEEAAPFSWAASPGETRWIWIPTGPPTVDRLILGFTGGSARGLVDRGPRRLGHAPLGFAELPAAAWSQASISRRCAVVASTSTSPSAPFIRQPPQ